jgi:hypothetical protein
MSSEQSRGAPTSQIDALTTARLLAIGRTVFGAAALLSPKRAGRMFLGDLVDAPGGVEASRGFGGRDVALGLGFLIADRRGRPLRGWLEAGVLVDALDCLTGLVAGGGLPLGNRLAAIVGGGLFAAAGISAATGLRAEAGDIATPDVPPPPATR